MNQKNLTYLDFTKKPEFSEILTNPILDIAARFWEKERYNAFQVCYRSMRVIDDLVDDWKTGESSFSHADKKQIEQIIKNWMTAFTSGKPIDDFQATLIEIRNRFQIPLWPWQRLANAMVFDIYHDSFKSFLIFLRYTEGAAIAPASIFMHLCGIKKSANTFVKPDFEIRKAARTLAVFSYLVHIIRDFQKDQQSSLNYFARTMIDKNKLTPDEIRRAAVTGNIPDNVRFLIKDYVKIADYYRLKARKEINQTLPLLKPQYQLSLEVIYTLYNQIYERIDWEKGLFTASELQPGPDQVKLQIENEISRFQPKS